MEFICPECKNSLDVEKEKQKAGEIIECSMCGITLMLKEEGNKLALEVVDEGK